jgi:hypothetical protein
MAPGAGVQEVTGLCSTIQPHIHSLQQVGFVEHRLDDVALGARQATVRRDRLDRSVERVVAVAALEGLGLELRVEQPIGNGLVVADQLTGASEQVALEVVGLGRLAAGIESRVSDDAGGVGMPVDSGTPD